MYNQDRSRSSIGGHHHSQLPPFSKPSSLSGHPEESPPSGHQLPPASPFQEPSLQSQTQNNNAWHDAGPPRFTPPALPNLPTSVPPTIPPVPSFGFYEQYRVPDHPIPDALTHPPQQGQFPAYQPPPLPPPSVDPSPFYALSSQSILAGVAQQFVSQGTGGASAAAAIAPQLMKNLGVSQYFSSDPHESAHTFMRIPKFYFAVNHSYVLKKLLLLLLPFTKRSWSRRRAVDTVPFGRVGVESASLYVPPRDDVNAPDLYIPVMSFMTYVLLVGFVFGTRDAFTAEVLARYCTKGLGVLTLEVLLIKLGLYLISAQPSPWLDVMAYRGYKFVGVIVAMIVNIISPKLYLASYGYASIAMFIFLLRSHRRIILPRELDRQQTTDVAQRNAFLLFVCALQFPIYWILILDVRHIAIS